MTDWASKARVWARIAVAAVVATAAIGSAIRVWGTRGTPWVALSVLILLVIFWREFRHRGDDERSLGIKYRAGYYAYLISLYLWLALRFFENRLNASQTFVFGMVGMSLAFGFSWVFLHWREGS